jgi:RimJ/RimL family protein N-acetyltransferase
MQLIGSILVGADKEVADWVRTRIPHMGERDFGPCAALGVMKDGQPVAGVVYHALTEHVVEVSIAAEPGSRWCSRSVLKALFGYPFGQVGCVTMVARTGKKNHKARKLLKGLGFALVGPIPSAIDGKEDALIFTMRRKDCRWLGDNAK